MDNQDFDTAISVCTSSKGKGDAYMGKGGFTVTNLLNNSGIDPANLLIICQSSPTELIRRDEDLEIRLCSNSL